MRINVESDLFTDQRFLDMVIELKSVEMAIGALVRCWMIAQKFWKNSNSGIPKVEWSKQKLNDALVSHGLAEDRGDFVFVIGSEKHFAWLRERSESGKIGGLKSQENRRSIAQAKPSKRKQTQPSLSLSSSLSSSSSNSSSNSELKPYAGAAPATRGKSVATWEGYRASYQQRYGTAPIRNAKINSQLSQFVDRLGSDESPHVAEFYLTHEDAFYVKNMHPVSLMLRDAEKLRTEWATGSRMTGATAREIERRQHNSDSWDEAARILNDRRKTHEAV